MIQPSKTALTPFMACVKLLEFLGHRFNLTYKEISVVVNLWGQGIILLASGVLPLIAAICNNSSIAAILGWSFYALSYICGFVWMLRHYRLPFERAFDLCVDDLLWMAEKCKISYHAINLVLFVGVFLLLLAINIFIYIKI